jgi:hypothetical protein
VQFKFLLLLFFATTVHASAKNSGSAQFYGKQFSFPSTDDYSSTSAGVDLQWKFDWTNKGKWKFRSDLDLKTDFLAKDANEKTQFNPQSFYLDWKPSSLRFRAGYQTIIPEGPDVLNPADVIHSKNWTDPMSASHLGSNGISISQEIEAWQWEAFWIPEQTKPLLPGEHSPWWPREKRLPIESEDSEVLLPAGIRYEIQDPVELNQALKNNFAFRIQRKSESLEAQLLYYQGLSQDPYLNTNLSANLISLSPKQVVLVNSPARLIPLYYRHQVVAGTFVIPFESWSIKGGANWVKPLGDDFRLPGETSTGVLGIEKNIETRKGLMTVIVQHEVQQRQIKNQMSFLRSLYEDAWSLGLRVPWGEEMQFLGGVIYDSVGKSSILRLGGSRRLSDAWTIEADATWLQGPVDTTLGLYDRYDRYGLGLTYHW